VIALQAVKKIHQLGYKIPEDLGLLCFDEADSFDLFYAPLSYIRQPIKTMGELAVSRLIQQIDDPARPVEQIKLPGELVARASSAIVSRKDAM
jgi:LacI family transcriptional regulator